MLSAYGQAYPWAQSVCSAVQLGTDGPIRAHARTQKVVVELLLRVEQQNDTGLPATGSLHHPCSGEWTGV